MRKIVAVFVLLFVFSTPVFASEIVLQLNGVTLQPAVAPILESGTTLVPLRIVSENLGADIAYDGEARSITITKGDKVIYLVLDQTQVKVNDELKELSVAPKSVNGSTMVPIRFVTQTLDCTVNWDSEKQLISIIENGKAVASEPVSVKNEPKSIATPVGESKPVFTVDGKHQVINDENYPVYVTNTGTKYHIDGCPSLWNSQIPMTLGEATDGYYDACDRCKAPILDI